MAREPYSINLGAQAIRHTHSSAPVTTNFADGSHADELAIGVERRKPAGWIDPTPYTLRFQRYDRASGRAWEEVNSLSNNAVISFQKINGCVGGGSGAALFNSLNHFNDIYQVPSFPAALRDQALIKARLAMKDGNINLAVAFAERDKTARLVGDTALQLVKSLRHLRKGDWRGSLKALGINNPKKPRGSSVVNRWLETQYAWKPLLSDVYGASRALAGRDPNDWRITGKGSSVSRISVDKHQPIPRSQAYDGTARGLLGAFVRIDALPQNDLLMSFASSGILNPALVAWELVPFSFVADWFLPVGSWLDSLDAMLGYGPTTCSISLLRRCDWHGQGFSSLLTESGKRYKYTNEWSESKKFVDLVRTVSYQVPLPSMPRLKDPRSLQHMANGLSLLASVFAGRR